MFRVWLPRIGIVGLVALAFAAPAWAHDGELPDLVADPVEDPVFESEAGEGGVERLLLRFHSWVHNDGVGPLEVRRAPGGFSQQVFRDVDAGPTLPEVATAGLAPEDLKFEDTDGHNHWHVQRIARYSLVSGDGAYTVAPAMKVGFCLLDSDQVTPGAPQTYGSLCGQNQPNPSFNVRMGVSSGWRDLYDKSLPFQWVDVSEVLPGIYRLRSEVDPYDVIEESDEANVPSDVLNQAVRGFNADAVSSATNDVTLDADPVGPVSGPRFKVVDGPEHGTLDVAVGDWLTSPDVSYTGTDPDRFVYVVADDDSEFPRYPGRATALLGTSGVALSGVPEQMTGGVTIDLDATVVGAPGAVTWSTTGGTIDPATGVLTAPLADGTITVTASAPGDRSDAMAIRVVAPPAEPEPAPTVPDDPPPGAILPDTSPPAQPLPTPPGPPIVTKPTPKPKRTPIGSVRVRRIGRQYVVSVVPRSSGRLRTTLLKGKRKLGTCTVRVAARKSALCRLKVRSGATAIAVTLVKRTGGSEQRRVSAPR